MLQIAGVLLSARKISVGLLLIGLMITTNWTFLVILNCQSDKEKWLDLVISLAGMLGYNFLTLKTIITSKISYWLGGAWIFLSIAMSNSEVKPILLVSELLIGLILFGNQIMNQAPKISKKGPTVPHLIKVLDKNTREGILILSENLDSILFSNAALRDFLDVSILDSGFESLKNIQVIEDHLGLEAKSSDLIEYLKSQKDDIEEDSVSKFICKIQGDSSFGIFECTVSIAEWGHQHGYFVSFSGKQREAKNRSSFALEEIKVANESPKSKPFIESESSKLISKEECNGNVSKINPEKESPMLTEDLSISKIEKPLARSSSGENKMKNKLLDLTSCESVSAEESKQINSEEAQINEKPLSNNSTFSLKEVLQISQPLIESQD